MRRFSVLYQKLFPFGDQSNTLSLVNHATHNNHHACEGKFEERIIEHPFG